MAQLDGRGDGTSYVPCINSFLYTLHTSHASFAMHTLFSHTPLDTLNATACPYCTSSHPSYDIPTFLQIKRSLVLQPPPVVLDTGNLLTIVVWDWILRARRSRIGAISLDTAIEGLLLLQRYQHRPSSHEVDVYHSPPQSSDSTLSSQPKDQTAYPLESAHKAIHHQPPQSSQCQAQSPDQDRISAHPTNRCLVVRSRDPRYRLLHQP